MACARSERGYRDLIKGDVLAFGGTVLPETTPELDRRRLAVAELGAQLRALVDASVRTEVPTETVERTAAAVRELIGPLTERTRSLRVPPSVDDLVGGVRLLNPVIGAGNPIAPPLRVLAEPGRVTAEFTLGLVYEGPHMYGHGGISALLLDQVLGHAAASAGNAGVTTGLSLSYRKPVPLDVPLRIDAEVTEVDERRTTVKGAIVTAAEPDVPLVEAEGAFLRLRPDQVKRLFAKSLSADTADPEAAHD